MKKLLPLLPFVALLAIFGCTSPNSRYVTPLPWPKIIPSTSSPGEISKPSAPPQVREPIKKYRITNAFNLFLYSPEDFVIVSSNKLGTVVGGYFEFDTRTMHVPYSPYGYDMRSNRLPNFDTLGHELWHLPELGGSWHSNIFQNIKR